MQLNWLLIFFWLLAVSSKFPWCTTFVKTSGELHFNVFCTKFIYGTLSDLAMYNLSILLLKLFQEQQIKWCQIYMNIWLFTRSCAFLVVETFSRSDGFLHHSGHTLIPLCNAWTNTLTTHANNDICWHFIYLLILLKCFNVLYHQDKCFSSIISSKHFMPWILQKCNFWLLSYVRLFVVLNIHVSFWHL